ncbi:MAG: lipopolysaccharide biosynthesis protein [Candidatus Scalindua rubra]|uniref:Lipopolysaccharide biosynthesis protein n=1 Tax=Candidatus Scalindua rubra TaxID=1872076 RepID=A0A1E3X572_9BACT|nr:MAG: lipopolysaccharide biosynthesis protein [Candidatus Scalindua rubra]
MQRLTDNEKKILELVKKHPAILSDRAEREKVAVANGMTEKTMRNRIADLKRYGLVDDHGFVRVKKGSSYEKHVMNVSEEVTGLTVNDYVVLFLQRKKTIIRNLIIFCLLTLVITLLMPRTYQASTVIMPPTTRQSEGMLSLISNLPIGAFGLSGEGSESLTLVAILKSRTMLEGVVKEFNLVDLYGTENVEEAVEYLAGKAYFEIEEEGTIRVTTDVSTPWFSSEEDRDKSKLLAAHIANYFVAELDRTNKEQKTEKARFQRMFVEERYLQNITDLRDSEESLQKFQEKYKMIALPEQTTAAIEVAAATKSHILAAEVRLGVLKNYLNPNHPDVISLEKEIELFHQKLSEMEFGSEKKSSDRLFPLFSEVPDLGIQLARLMREVEIQNTLFTFLTQQYEEAKIQEAKDTPTVQILDTAVAPEQPIKPRVFFLLATAIIASFLSTFFVHGIS